MAASMETMPMALSPGLDAIKGSDLSSSTDSLQLGDYLDLGASSSSPVPSYTATTASRAPPMMARAGSSSTNKLPPLINAKGVDSSNAPSAPSPPPPGSSPEAIFRHYLKIELRKMGANADDATVNRYVQQHYGTFMKAMDSNSSTSSSSKMAPTKTDSATKAPAAKPMSSLVDAQDSTAMSTTPASPLIRTESHLMSASPPPQPSPFKVPMMDTGADLVEHLYDQSVSEAPAYDSIDPHYVQFSSSSKIKQESDAMSEDDIDPTTTQEDDKDELAPLISEMGFRGNSAGPSTTASRSDAGSSRGSEEPHSTGGIPASIRESAAGNLKYTPEEYRALSSKEKRQIRNKISARNFRERRKEYVTHLEEQIADRDSLISSLRGQLSTMSIQNKKLEEEVKTLQARSISQTDVQRILEALTSAAGNGNNQADQSTPVHHSLSGLRNSSYQDPTLAGSRPTTPMSPRPHMMLPSSSSAASSSSTLPTFNPRKDAAPNSAGSGNGQASSGSNGGFWKAGGFVSASA